MFLYSFPLLSWHQTGPAAPAAYLFDVWIIYGDRHSENKLGAQKCIFPSPSCLIMTLCSFGLAFLGYDVRWNDLIFTWKVLVVDEASNKQEKKREKGKRESVESLWIP